MIKIENANLGDRVLTHDMHKGEIIDFSLSDANRCYITIKLDDGNIAYRPLDMCNKLNDRNDP